MSAATAITGAMQPHVPVSCLALICLLQTFCSSCFPHVTLSQQNEDEALPKCLDSAVTNHAQYKCMDCIQYSIFHPASAACCAGRLSHGSSSPVMARHMHMQTCNLGNQVDQHMRMPVPLLMHTVPVRPIHRSLPRGNLILMQDRIQQLRRLAGTAQTLSSMQLRTWPMGRSTHPHLN